MEWSPTSKPLRPNIAKWYAVTGDLSLQTNLLQAIRERLDAVVSGANLLAP